MSHFSVAVITKERPSETMLENILEKYSENLRVEPYVFETQQQYLEKERKHLEDYKNSGCYAEYIENPVLYEQKYGDRKEHMEYVKNFMEQHYNVTDEELIARRNSQYAHYDDADVSEYGEYLDKDGNLITTYNSNSKWDWWVVGGRWSGCLKLKSGGEADIAQIKDVDFNENMDIEALKKNEEIVNAYNKLITEGDSFYKLEYLQKLYPNIESYIISRNAFTTFAVVDVDGVWHEKGEMGWFGCSSATPEDAINWNASYYDTFIKNLDKDWYITIVDCHI